MTLAARAPSQQKASPAALPSLRLLVLARAACDDGFSKAELYRDLGFAVSAVATGASAAKQALEAELATLIRAGLVAENKSRFRLTDPGKTTLSLTLGPKLVTRSWAELRDGRLVAKALGLDPITPARLKALAKPDHLRAEILGARYGFKFKGAPSAPGLRAELALVALERAFGNPLKSAMSARSGFNAKAARMLAGQLLAKPRDPGTDSRLVAMLAAEAVGAAKPDADHLRHAIIRQFAAQGTVLPSTVIATAPAATAPAVAPLAASPTVARPPAASRPGLPGFAVAVNNAAVAVAEGWPGNRKALISQVWKTISGLHPEWGLSEIEFKAMLAEAHRTGHLVLATADLKDKSKVRELQASAIAYKNTVWHLVRIQE